MCPFGAFRRVGPPLLLSVHLRLLRFRERRPLATVPARRTKAVQFWKRKAIGVDALHGDELQEWVMSAVDTRERSIPL